MGPPGNHEAGSQGGDRTPAEADGQRDALEFEFGAFTAGAVDALAREGTHDPDRAVEQAVRTYLCEVRQRPEWEVAAGLSAFEATAPEVTVALDLHGDERERLEAEAGRQNVPVERLVEQAVIVAYAELDRRRA